MEAKTMRVFEIEHRKLYSTFLDNVYDSLMDSLEENKELSENYSTSLTSESGIRELFRGGYTMMMLPSKIFEELDKLIQADELFAIRVVHNGKTFAWINCEDAQY